MRSFNEIFDDATERRAFANGASWDRWSWQWCQQCVHDRDDDCPLVTVAVLAEKTPREWREVSLDWYECSEFEPEEEQ